MPFAAKSVLYFVVQRLEAPDGKLPPVTVAKSGAPLGGQLFILHALRTCRHRLPIARVRTREPLRSLYSSEKAVAPKRPGNRGHRRSEAIAASCDLAANSERTTWKNLRLKSTLPRTAAARPSSRRSEKRSRNWKNWTRQTPRKRCLTIYGADISPTTTAATHAVLSGSSRKMMDCAACASMRATCRKKRTANAPMGHEAPLGGVR